jgi:hypothetical protein
LLPAHRALGSDVVVTLRERRSMFAHRSLRSSGAPLPTLAACIDSYAQAYWLAHRALESTVVIARSMQRLLCPGSLLALYVIARCRSPHLRDRGA